MTAADAHGGETLLAHKAAQEAEFAAMVPPAPDRPPAGPQPVSGPGDPDPGGRDDVAGDVAAAVANAEARFGELQGDTYGLGSHIGDLMDLPPGPDTASKHLGGPDTGYAA